MQALLIMVIGIVTMAVVLTTTSGVITLVALVGLIAAALTYEHYLTGKFDSPVEPEPTEHGV